MYARIPPHIQVRPSNEGFLLIGDERHCLRTTSVDVGRALQALANPCGASADTVREHVGDEALALLAALRGVGCLQLSKQPFKAVGGGTSAYFSCIGGDAWAPLHQRSATVIGLGGVGGEVARHLVASGLRHLSLVDGDKVHLDNLNRQYLFTHEDIGQSKVVAAAAALKRLVPELEVTTRDCYVSSKTELEALGLPKTDIVLCCADRPVGVIQPAALQFARSRGEAFCMAGVGLRGGSWGPLIPAGSSASFESLGMDTSASARQSLVPMDASFGPTNSLISAAMALDVIHHLAGLEVVSENKWMKLTFGDMANAVELGVARA